MILLAMLLSAAAPDCRNAVAQADLNRCEAQRFTRADAALNAVWRRLTDAKAVQPALLGAQRQWLRFRDAECAAEAAAYEGGSMQPMVRTGCLADLTEERVKRVRALASDAER